MTLSRDLVISSSRGATRDGLFRLLLVRRLQLRLQAVQDALRHGIPALDHDPDREDGLVVTSLQAGSLEGRRISCSRVHPGRSQRAARIPLVAGHYFRPYGAL